MNHGSGYGPGRASVEGGAHCFYAYCTLMKCILCFRLGDNQSRYVCWQPYLPCPEVE